MRKSLLIGALCAASFSLQLGAGAQAPVELGDAPTATKSGYDLLLEARALADNVPDETSVIGFRVPQRNWWQQALISRRNTLALARLRQALQIGIEVPPQKSAEEDPRELLAPAREMARALVQEADARAANGDITGALASDFDALKLGEQIGRGSLVNWINGARIVTTARKNLFLQAPLLNAAQSREAAAQWEKINAERPQYKQLLRIYEQETLRLVGSTLPQTPEDLKFAAEPQGNDFFSPEQVRQIQALTSPIFKTNLGNVIRVALDQADLPYQIASKAAPIAGADPYAAMSAEFLSSAPTRFNFEHDVVINRLTVAALRLHAIKLESGAYPTTFDAGVDPFSLTLAPLIYRRDGDSYILYSVGPDGKDENGAEVQTLETDSFTGIKRVTDLLKPDSSGDIVAPVF